MTPSAPSRREARDWTLFADWCTSMDLPALPTSAETLADFLTAFPSAIGTQGHRVRAVRRAHERADLPLALPTPERPTALRSGPDWASVPRALAQLPTHAHRGRVGTAIRGRRDGWLLVLVGILGFTRREAAAVLEHDVTLFPRIAVQGRPVDRLELADECPACAVTRWLRIAGPVSFGWWNDVKDTVGPDAIEEGAHDCWTGLDGTWRQAQTLLPAVDRHGWVSGEAMSTRAISAVLADRQRLSDIPKPPSIEPTVATGRFASASMSELADAYDDVDERAAALLLRMKEIVGESTEMLSHIQGFGL